MAAIAATAAPTPSTAAPTGCVIVLHGLARTSNSMKEMAGFLEDQGYTVANVDYPSRDYPIEVLAPMALEAGLKLCGGQTPVDIVAHSLGGILVRAYLAEHTIEGLRRVVMLAPPNQGSEVVDALKDFPGFAWLNGPAGRQLGTDPDSVPAQLGPVDFELGVIAGNRTINFILSQYLPNPDDGKVSVASTRVEGMADHVVVERTHPFMMDAPEVQEYTLRFVQTGRFETGSD